MNVHYTFEPSDFDGCGQMLTVARGEGSVDLLYKIGYIKRGPESNAITLVAMTDGWVQVFEDVQTLCQYLNNHAPGFRPATGKDLHAVQRQGNRLHSKHMVEDWTRRRADTSGGYQPEASGGDMTPPGDE